MKSTEPKRFKSKREQLFEILVYGLLFIGGFVFSIDIILQDESTLIKQWGEQRLGGSSGQQLAQAIEMFVVNVFGKTGFLIINLFIEIFLATECLFPTISTYRRFKTREREIREGLRAPDDYIDDYVRVRLWKKIVNLFAIKRKKKYPSESEMRESLKKNKYYKE